MKIYIAGHNQQDAQKIANLLKINGHEITSTWVWVDMDAEGELDKIGKRGIADKDIREVCNSDALLIFASPRRVPGGKFVECGAAIAKGLKVILVGHRENFLMYHSNFERFDSVENFISAARYMHDIKAGNVNEKTK